MEVQATHTKPDARTRRAAMQEFSDEELMEQLQAGVVDAFDILVDRYSEPLQFYLYGFVADRAEVDDLLQETFIRVFRNRHSYQRIARFSTWLYTIAGNLARSEYRKRKRNPTTPIVRSTRGDEQYEIDLPDRSKLPDRMADQPIYHRELDRALGELDPRFREVVVLRDVQQLTYDEIADITGAPMGTVKSRIHRGREMLKKLLADVYPFQTN